MTGAHLTAASGTRSRRARGGPRWAPFVALVIVLAGCGTGIIPDDVAMPAGSREWIMTVDNQSAEGARLLVALDTMPVGDLVGTADGRRRGEGSQPG